MISLETDPRNRVLLLLMYTSGLRVSEACNLLRERGDTGQLTICGNGGKTRAVLLPPAMWKEDAHRFGRPGRTCVSFAQR